MSRIAAALNSDDLTHKDKPCDADTVRALGLTAIHRSIGVLILEAKEGCAGESAHDSARIRELISAVKVVVAKQASRDKLEVNHSRVAALLVKELVLDRCPRCQGRGYLPLAYGPEQPIDERGVDCPICFTTGRARRDFQERATVAGHENYGYSLKRFYEAVESRLADAEIAATHHYRQRFRTT